MHILWDPKVVLTFSRVWRNGEAKKMKPVSWLNSQRGFRRRVGRALELQSGERLDSAAGDFAEHCFKDPTSVMQPINGETVGFLVELCQNPMFLQMNNAWNVLNILSNNWAAFAAWHRHQLGKAMVAAYPTFPEEQWMERFIICQLMGDNFADAFGLGTLQRFAQSPDFQLRRHVPDALLHLVRECNNDQLADMAQREIQGMLHDPALEVREEAQSASARMNQWRTARRDALISDHSFQRRVLREIKFGNAARLASAIQDFKQECYKDTAMVVQPVRGETVEFMLACLRNESFLKMGKTDEFVQILCDNWAAFQPEHRMALGDAMADLCFRVFGGHHSVQHTVCGIMGVCFGDNFGLINLLNFARSEDNQLREYVPSALLGLIWQCDETKIAEHAEFEIKQTLGDLAQNPEVRWEAYRSVRRLPDWIEAGENRMISAGCA